MPDPAPAAEVGAETGEDDEAVPEVPELPVLQEALQSDVEELRIDAVEQISAFVAEAYGAEGELLGMSLRESGTVKLLAKLVGDPSDEVRAHALLALGNLCSDSVDPSSAVTKALLLELGTDRALMDCIGSSDESVMLVACATLQNLCHDAAWAQSIIAAGMESRLEALVSHTDPRVVRYASGALKNLTIASATVGSKGPQLSASASHAIKQREHEASIEAFVRRRAVRRISRVATGMDPQKRLARLIRVPADMRTMTWLDALSELYAVIEDEAAVLEKAHAAASPNERVALHVALTKCRAMLTQAEATVAEALGELPEELPGQGGEGPGAASSAGAASGSAGAPTAAGEIEEEEGAKIRSEPPSPARGGNAGAEEVPEEVEEHAAASPGLPRTPLTARPGATGSEQLSTPTATKRPSSAAGSGLAAVRSAQQPSPATGPAAAAASSTSGMPAEANRVAAEEWLAKAREKHQSGDDGTASKYCEKSLKLCETPAARTLADHLRKYGAGSAAAAAVARVLQAPEEDAFAVLGLGRTATAAEVKKAYKRLSLTIHPDRNHARLADEAFKRVSAAYATLSQGGELSTAQPPTAPAADAGGARTPRPPPHPAAADQNGGDWSDGTPHGPNPVRRRRRWERALGLGAFSKKKAAE